MNMSDDLLGKINQLLEAKPRLSFNNDGCDVLDKGGNCVRSFKQKDLGEKYKKSAEVFLQQNYKTLNSEGFVWKESKHTKPCKSCKGTGKIDGKDCDHCNGSGEHVIKESEDIKELTKKTLKSYVKKSREDSNDKTNDLHFDYHHTDGNHGDTADRFGGMHASGHDKLDQRNNGIQGAADRMTDKKYGKAKPGKKTKLSKPLRSHPDDKPSTRYESQEVQEISKGVLNTYQGKRRNDHDILGSRSAYHHQRAMDHGQGNYYSGTEKGKDKSDAHKEIAHYGPMSKDKAKKTFKKVEKHRDKESHNDNERHKMSTGIDRAFNRLASDKYGKAKPGQKTKLAKDVKEMEEGMVDAVMSKLHPSRPERNAASRRQDAEASRKKAVKSAVASTVAKSLEKKQIKESNEVDSHEIEVHPETPMTNMERIAGFISAQTKVQSADGTSMMGVKKDIQEKKMSKAEFKDMMAGKGKKDKGDMDGDGKQEPDDKEYMDNKDEAIKKSMGKKGKKDDMEEAIDQKSTDPEKSIGHNCATHVEHVVFGAGECIPGMHTLDETSEGEGVVTHYDVMFTIDNEPVIKENVRVEELKVVKEMHHGHKKKK